MRQNMFGDVYLEKSMRKKNKTCRSLPGVSKFQVIIVDVALLLDAVVMKPF